MSDKPSAEQWVQMIGKAIAGNGRLSDGRTLVDKYPERYANPLTDWVNLLITEAKLKHSLERASLDSPELAKEEDSDNEHTAT